jgi:release factor glutamine methyltransferase
MYNVNDYLNSYITDNILLLALVLEKNHAWLITNKDYILTSEEKNTLKPLIEQREQGVPFAYLSGVKGFYHLDFIVTPDTFIPRPETELLIDITLDLFKDKSCRLLDLGTGSGIIAITLADKNPYWQVVATDFSKQALELAKQNTVINIDFQQGNWFEAVQDKQFNLIISNPPYIKQDDPCLKDLIYEPQNSIGIWKRWLR